MLWERDAPGSTRAADSYANLGGVLRDQGKTDQAEQLVLKAIECWEAVGQDSLDLAIGLGNLADWRLHDGDLDGAEPLLMRSLKIREEKAPGGDGNALALQSVGFLAVGRGQVKEAEKNYRLAIEMFENHGVATTALADTWYLLGCLLRDTGSVEEALTALTQAVDVLEGVVGRLGGSAESHSDFRATHHDKYQALIDMLVDLDRSEQAFHLLERSRARGFLTLLEQRDLLFENDISPELDRERRLARVEVERATVALSQASADEAISSGELQRSLQESHVRLREVQDLIRSQAPRLAALTNPEPLDLERSRHALDEGTVVLSYSVGAERTQLFVVGPDPGDFRAVTMELSDEVLRRKIRRLRNAVTWPASDLETVRRLCADLTRLLVAPARDEIARSSRVLFVPDGPLHLLPFAVLHDPDGEGYLIEAKPVHCAASVTVYAELKGERRQPSEWRVAGLGAPQYPDSGNEWAASLLNAYTRGEPLLALPFSGEEVAALRDLFPDSASVWLGADATEERARRAGVDVDALHLACHGLVDEVRPLESALIFSAPEQPEPGEHDGLLQAWEILESVRIDARLVVLSACRTALGREIAGEGIVGLTRAFQYAGAHSVVASLWAVSDRSTAELMLRFYRHLAAGSSTDEALRAAQLELASGSVKTANGDILDATHPYFWAAFQLSGDWR